MLTIGKIFRTKTYYISRTQFPPLNYNHVFKFCGKILGNDHPPLIVAETGFNHNGDIGLAREMIRADTENGADAVKF